MAHTSIAFPETVSLRQLVEWNKHLWRASNEIEIRIDFKATRFFTPFAMMFIVHQLKHYKSKFRTAVVVLENYDHLAWPEHMGFFSTLEPVARLPGVGVMEERKSVG